MEQPKNTVNERVAMIIKEFENNRQTSFAKKVGVNPSVINSIIGTRQTEPSFAVLVKILVAYKELNPDWLMQGEGEMIRSVYQNTLIESVALSTNKEESLQWAKKLIDRLESENTFLRSIITQAGLGKNEVHPMTAFATVIMVYIMGQIRMYPVALRA